jgi:hypothetical protein
MFSLFCFQQGLWLRAGHPRCLRGRLQDIFYFSKGYECGLGIPGVYTDVYKMLRQDNFWLCDFLGLSRSKCPASKRPRGDEDD